MEIGREGRSNLDLGARNVLHLARFGGGLFYAGSNALSWEEIGAIERI